MDTSGDVCQRDELANSLVDYRGPIKLDESVEPLPALEPVYVRSNVSCDKLMAPIYTSSAYTS